MELINVVYTGSIYRGKENPLPMLDAAVLLLQQGAVKANEIKIEHYGPVYEWLSEEVKKRGLDSVLVQHGIVSHEQAIEAQRDARFLWLMKWESTDKGVIPSKLFEYMAARRPIIVTGGYPDTALDVMLFPQDIFSLGYWCKTPAEIAGYLSSVL